MSMQTRECSVEELRSELKTAIKQYMSGDDKPLMCCETKSEDNLLTRIMDLIDFRAPTGFVAQVVTQHRIIQAQSGKYGNSASSMLLLDIVNVQEENVGDHYYVSVYGRGNTLIECFLGTQQVSRKFTNILREAIEQAKSVPTALSAQPPRSVEERLRALTQMHKDGLISDTEFQQKRKEILGQL